MQTVIMLTMGVGSMVLSYVYLKQKRLIKMIMLQYEELFTRFMQQEFRTKIKAQSRLLKELEEEDKNNGQD
jgi:hypothetical protein